MEMWKFGEKLQSTRPEIAFPCPKPPAWLVGSCAPSDRIQSSACVLHAIHNLSTGNAGENSLPQ